MWRWNTYRLTGDKKVAMYSNWYGSGAAAAVRKECLPAMDGKVEVCDDPRLIRPYILIMH